MAECINEHQEYSSSSNSRYSEEEILVELHAMGYQIPTDKIADLKHAVDYFLQMDEQQTIQQLRPSFRNNESDQHLNPYRLLNTARFLHQKTENEIGFVPIKPETSDSIRSLLKEGEQKSTSIHTEIERIENRLLENRGGKDQKENGNKMVNDDHNAYRTAVLFGDLQTLKSPSNNGALKDLDSDLKEHMEIDENPEIPSQELNDYLQASRRWEKRDKLANLAIRPVIFPPPGSAAYKHDPVKRYQQYEKQWLKRPVPGTNKRLELRWKVREYMLRQDFPAIGREKRRHFDNLH